MYETQLIGQESYGSICSGGRYDALASDGKTSYPGVGISVGVTRLLAKLFDDGLVEVSRPSPTVVLVALGDESDRPQAMRTAATLRERGIAAEVAPAAAKFGKQIKFAERRGIPFVWFAAGPESGETDSVKDIRSGDQVPADAGRWQPDPSDLTPSVSHPVSDTATDE